MPVRGRARQALAGATSVRLIWARKPSGLLRYSGQDAPRGRSGHPPNLLVPSGMLSSRAGLVVMPTAGRARPRTASFQAERPAFANSSISVIPTTFRQPFGIDRELGSFLAPELTAFTKFRRNAPRGSPRSSSQ